MTKGIVTYADSDFIESAKLLALTAKKFSNLPTTLVTNVPIEADEFDNVIVAPCRYAEEGIAIALMASPYNQTAFIYADSLVLSDIADYFNLLDKQDFVFSIPKDFKSELLDSSLFIERNMISKNKLPDIWTNFFLYKKEAMEEITRLIPTLMDLWPHIKETACPHYSNDEGLKFHFITVMSIALKELGKITPASYNIPFVHMGTPTAVNDKPWYQLLSYWATDDGCVKVENYVQQGVWHYTCGFMDESKASRLRQICLT
jgi:hypothetical protein